MTELFIIGRGIARHGSAWFGMCRCLHEVDAGKNGPQAKKQFGDVTNRTPTKVKILIELMDWSHMEKHKKLRRMQSLQMRRTTAIFCTTGKLVRVDLIVGANLSGIACLQKCRGFAWFVVTSTCVQAYFRRSPGCCGVCEVRPTNNTQTGGGPNMYVTERGKTPRTSYRNKLTTWSFRLINSGASHNKQNTTLQMVCAAVFVFV